MERALCKCRDLEGCFNSSIKCRRKRRLCDCGRNDRALSSASVRTLNNNILNTHSNNEPNSDCSPGLDICVNLDFGVKCRDVSVLRAREAGINDRE